MSDDFQQTVDLKLKKEAKPKPRNISREAFTNAKEIDEIYQEKEGTVKKDFKKIEKYQEPQVNEGIFKKVLIFLIFVVVILVLYFMVFSTNKVDADKKILNWYAIKLTTGEIYYGEIEDEKANPVVINNVYYNYDQIKEDGSVDTSFSMDDTKNIRLVKMGKETYGPSGKMLIYQSQINRANELDVESKVLQAIINYEK